MATTQASLDLEINNQMPSGAQTPIANVRQVLHDMCAAIFQSAPPASTPSLGAIPVGNAFGGSAWSTSLPAPISITDVTQSVSLATGAAIISGGVAIGGNINSGGTISSLVSGVNGMLAANVGGITYVGSVSNHPVGLIANNTELLRGQNGVQIGSPTGGDKGLGSLNLAASMYANGTLVRDGSGNHYSPIAVTGTGVSGTLSSSTTIISASGTFTLTLPNAATNIGRWLFVKTIANFPTNSASSNVVPIGTATPGTAMLTNTAGKWAAYQSDGVNWITMMAN